jgi:signal transduction histidine kinase
MWRKLARNLLGYLVAIAAVGLTIPIKMYLSGWLQLRGPEVGVAEQEAPFMLSLAAVMVAGWYGGLGPGLFATFLAAISGDYFFMWPYHALGLQTRVQWVRLCLFLTEGLVISGLSQTLKTARRRAEENEREARGLQRELLEITDTEQRRIGHDLHDGLGQHLTGIAFMSKLIEQRLAGRAIPEAEDARKIAGLVNKAIGWTRDLARGLAPVDLDQEDGLSSALRQLADSADEFSGVSCAFETNGEVRVTRPAVSIHLYRIAQEALNNAIKHARARNIVVHLTAAPGEIRVTVEDDGNGFDPEKVRTGGMGLRIMKYRAKMISGRLEVGGREGGGTVVACSCPVRGAVANNNTKDESYGHRNQVAGS